MNLAHKYVNLKESYNQDMKEQVTTKKEDRLYMKSPTPEAYYAEDVFQLQSPTCGVNFSNNINNPGQVQWDENLIDSTFETS